MKTIEEVFMDKDYLRVMYFLARHGGKDGLQIKKKKKKIVRDCVCLTCGSRNFFKHKKGCKEETNKYLKECVEVHRQVEERRLKELK